MGYKAVLRNPNWNDDIGKINIKDFLMLTSTGGVLTRNHYKRDETENVAALNSSVSQDSNYENI